jgi:hypothetical protein
MEAFDYIKLLNEGNAKDTELDNNYVKFLTNRAFSYHIETLPLANYLNEYPDMDNQMHFDFLAHTVTPAKRWAKWHKPEKHSDAYIVSNYFGISLKHAYMYVDLISAEDIQDMREQLEVEK